MNERNVNEYDCWSRYHELRYKVLDECANKDEFVEFEQLILAVRQSEATLLSTYTKSQHF